jgi:hypothetical protein
MLIVKNVDYFRGVLEAANKLRDGLNTDGTPLSASLRETGLKAHDSFVQNIRYLSTYGCYCDDPHEFGVQPTGAEWMRRFRAAFQPAVEPAKHLVWSRCVVVLFPDRGHDFDVVWYWRDKYRRRVPGRAEFYRRVQDENVGIRFLTDLGYKKGMDGGLCFHGGGGNNPFEPVSLTNEVGWQIHT